MGVGLTLLISPLHRSYNFEVHLVKGVHENKSSYISYHLDLSYLSNQKNCFRDNIDSRRLGSVCWMAHRESPSYLDSEVLSEIAGLKQANQQ